jgi:hypothetical protein
MQHFADVDHAADQRRVFWFGNHSKVAGELNVPFNFRYGAESVPKVSREFAMAFVCVTLDDIGRYRHRGAHKLIRERSASHPPYANRHASSFDREFLRCLPNAKISEIAHT